jgi:hypothetical protein
MEIVKNEVSLGEKKTQLTSNQPEYESIVASLYHTMRPMENVRKFLGTFIKMRMICDQFGYKS